MGPGRVGYSLTVSIFVRPGPSRVQAVVVGTDVVEVESVADSIRTFGMRYLARVFTPSEQRYCESVTEGGGNSAPHFAARFAAKEAVMKVLRPRASDAVPWTSIEVVRTPRGFCKVRLHGAARSLARRARLRAFEISLSHEAHYAAAVALAQRGPKGSARIASRSSGRTAGP